MRDFRIGSLVTLAMGAIMALLALLAVSAWRGMSRQEASFAAVTENTFPLVQAIDGIVLSRHRLQENANLIQSPALDDKLRERAHRDMADGRFDLEAAISKFEKLPRPATQDASWARLEPALAAWTDASMAYVDATAPWEDLLRQTDPAATPAELAAAQKDSGEAWQRAHKLYDAAEKELLDLRQAVLATLGEEKAAAAAAQRRARVVLVVSAAAIALMTLLIAALVRRRVAGGVRALVEEAAALGAAVREGRLDARADLTRIHGEFRAVLDGVNAIMDAYARPLAVTVESLTTLAAGEAPPLIAEEYAGDFDRIKQSVNDLVRVTKQRGKELDALIAAAVEGKLDHRADPSKYRGGNARLMESLNRMLDAVVGPLEVAASTVDRIAHGDIPEDITAEYRGEFAVLKTNLNTCMAAVRAVIADMDGLAGAAVAGRLSARADATPHHGAFRRIVEGMNATLDAVITPLDRAAHRVEEISRGELPPPIEAAWPGDFARLRDNLNTCLIAVHGLVEDMQRLAQAAREGQLSTRLDPAHHQGGFREVVEGANHTVEALLTPVRVATETLERVARRDLTARVTGAFAGDHARARDAVNRTAEALQGALVQVATAVDQVSGAAAQIASSSQAVAAGASEQASSLAATSASMASVGGMTARAADHAQQADGLARSARDAARDGAAAVTELQAAMGRIKASSQATSQIIRDVSDIAFQTNLLALNAAVEAARAGEAGRGFAVVAEEVRSLALRAKEAAAKTEELIQQSVRHTDAGAVTAHRVAGKLGDIAAGVERVTAAVTEIAAATREQTAGISGVNDAVTEMERVTQQNASSAEQSSAAASELSGQAEELAALVRSFRLEEAAAPAARLPGHARRPAALPAPRTARPPAGRPVDDAFPMDEGEFRDF